jgi:hypothetical protein
MKSGSSDFSRNGAKAQRKKDYTQFFIAPWRRGERNLFIVTDQSPLKRYPAFR